MSCHVSCYVFMLNIESRHTIKSPLVISCHVVSCHCGTSFKLHHIMLLCHAMPFMPRDHFHDMSFQATPSFDVIT